MSSSQKKKLRAEQNSAQLTEKQIAEQKEAKQLRTYTNLFITIIALMLCVVLVTSVVKSGFIQRQVTAATVNDSKISAAEFNYFYVDAVDSFRNEWGDYFMFSGLAAGKPLNEQVMDEETGKTWADYFVDDAVHSMKGAYALYNAALADGYTLNEDMTNQINTLIESMRSAAKSSPGFKDLNQYLRAIYGAGSNEQTFRHHLEVQLLASQYAQDHMDSLSYSDEQLRAKDQEDPSQYSSFSYHYIYLSGSSFNEGGTTDEEGKTTYTEEEKAAGLQKCEETAKLLSQSSISDAESFDAAIAALQLGEGKPSASIENKDVLKINLPSALAEWVSDASRKAGDLTLIPSESTTTDAEGKETTTVNGYYVVLFDGINDNTYHMANVRHILAAFQGGTKDENGQVIYSEEEKAAAKEKAEGILAQFQTGETTEEAFAALAAEKSDDRGSAVNGGLIADILPASNLVPSFRDWALDDSRKVGDAEIVESPYGFHVMYACEDSELNYRDTMIRNTLITADMNAWEDALVEATSAEIVSTKYVPMDLMIQAPQQ